MISRAHVTRRVALSAALGGAVSGCRAPAPTASGSDRRPVVLTTFTVLADIAREVAGPHLRIESLTKVGAEIHGYEPTPEDIRRGSNADLIIDNGLNLESWFRQFVADSSAPHVVASSGVTPIAIGEDLQAGRANPHAWMSPRNVQLYAGNIAAAFCDLDPVHAQVYRANARRYRTQLQSLHTAMRAELSRLSQAKRSIVTCEGAFSYLARDVDAQEKYIWAVNAERQSTPRRVASVIDFVRDHDVPAVFYESTVSPESMRRVAEATDARLAGPLYVDSLSQPDGPVPTYLTLMRHNMHVITTALTGSPT